MDSFREMTGAETLTALGALGRSARTRTVRSLIYRKDERPNDIREQLQLLDGLSRWNALTPFDRCYALVASAHKACELVDFGLCHDLLPRLAEAQDEAGDLPDGSALRMDRRHLTFSILNVALNLAVLVGGDWTGHFSDRALAEVDAINPRRVSGYFFNSGSNIVRVVGLAVVCRPHRLDGAARQLERVLFLGLRTKYARVPLWLNRRAVLPERLDEVEVPALFVEFRQALQQFEIIDAAAAEPDPAARQSLIGAIAGACLAQRNPAQKQALLVAVEKILAPGRSGET